MGQYYRPIIKSKQSKNFKVFNRYVNGEYTMAKLMEHSWWDNYFCGAVSKMLYNKPKQVAWVGDYAEDGEVRQTGMTVENIHHDVDGIGTTFTEGEFTLNNKFLCNHTKHVYIDLNKYKEKSTDKNGWVINPIPLLTAVGNGRGCGDYHSEAHAEDVGSWAFDAISVKDKPLRGYKEVDIYFKE